MTKSVIVFVALILLAACAESASSQGRKIAELCSAKMSYATGVCKCIGDKSVTDLTPEERKMVITMIDKNNSNAGEAAMNVPAGQLMKTGMFLTTAAATCAAQSL